MTVQLFGTSTFMINLMVFVALTRLSIPLEIIPSSFPTAFHQLSLSPTINKVSIVSFLSCLLWMWKAYVNLNKWLATRCCDIWVSKFSPRLRGERINRC